MIKLMSMNIANLVDPPLCSLFQTGFLFPSVKMYRTISPVPIKNPSKITWNNNWIIPSMATPIMFSPHAFLFILFTTRFQNLKLSTPTGD